MFLSIAAAVVVLGAVAAVVGPKLYRNAADRSGVAAPTVTLSPTGVADAGTRVAASDVDGSWQVTDGSYAGYRVKEVLNGTDVTVVGRTEKVTGSLTVSGLRLTSARIQVDVASIATDEPARDSYFRDTAMRVNRYPTAVFELASPVQASGTPKVGEAQSYDATGNLTLAGVTKQVTVQLQAAFDGADAQVAGSIPITFADYGVQAPSLGFVTVQPKGSVEFSLRLAKA